MFTGLNFSGLLKNETPNEVTGATKGEPGASWTTSSSFVMGNMLANKTDWLGAPLKTQQGIAGMQYYMFFWSMKHNPLILFSPQDAAYINMDKCCCTFADRKKKTSLMMEKIQLVMPVTKEPTIFTSVSCSLWVNRLIDAFVFVLCNSISPLYLSRTFM